MTMRLFWNFYRTPFVTTSLTRNLFTAPIKKFYKHVSIAQVKATDLSQGPSFEVQLDQRKLRTPSGNAFIVPNEGLALAVAQEWDSQKDTIKRYAMHLNTLCNRVLDWNLNPDSVVQGMMQYADTDTICFRSNEPDDLLALQSTAWDPVLHWASNRYRVHPVITHTLTTIVPMTEPDRDELTRHLLSYNLWGLVGIQSCVENLKSVFLSLAAVDGFCTAAKAVDLSLLEQTYQTQRWGECPSHHDMELIELKARVSAAVFFTLCTHQERQVKQKLPDIDAIRRQNFQPQ